MRQYGMALLIAMGCCGCALATGSETKGVWLTPSALTNLNRGISLAELKIQTGCEPQHQFTARLGSNDVSCVKLSFEPPRGRLYFLFRNGKLASIQQPPKAEFVMATYRGKPWEKPKPIHPEEQMHKVIQGKDLSADEIVERIRLLASHETQRARGEELTCFLLSRFFRHKHPLELPQYVKQQAWLRSSIHSKSSLG